MKVLLGLMGLLILFEGTWLFQNKPLEQSMADGEEIYQDFCLQCHLDNGKGVENAFPPLAKSDYLQNNIEASIRGIKYGLRGEITVNGNTYNGVMVNQGLDEEEVADVMNYILNSWGNKVENQITVAQVLEVKKQ
jgi:mono/diheme cytochrome c family protein